MTLFNIYNISFSEEEDFFEIAEAVFVGWFTFEYVIRFIAAPYKLRYSSDVISLHSKMTENCKFAVKLIFILLFFDLK